MFDPHQFLAWAGLHVIGVRIRILQRVATLETKEKKQEALVMLNKLRNVWKMLAKSHAV